MKAKLIIFDLDGTLLDTIRDLGEAANYALKKFGFPEHPVQEYNMMVGGGIRRLVSRALPEEDRTESIIDAVLNIFVDYYSAHLYDYTKPYDGIEGVLDTLRVGNGVCLAVASNKFDYGTQTLVSHFFPNVFSIVYGNKAGVPLKPDAEVVKRIMASCHASNSETFLIGDSGVDITTALNAGITPIGVEWGFRTREELLAAGAKAIVSFPYQIANIFTK